MTAPRFLPSSDDPTVPEVLREVVTEVIGELLPAGWVLEKLCAAFCASAWLLGLMVYLASLASYGFGR